jgi:hypothetical protein
LAIIPPSRCPFEHIKNPVQEAEQITETEELTVKLLDKRYPLKDDQLHYLSVNYPPSIRTLRGVHPKSHGCVQATFTVNQDIDPELRVGLFAEPGRQFAAFIRFSNAAALVGPDIDNGKHGSRGMAIKVLDVGGEVLVDDDGKHNQDFLMINQPVFAFANTQDYHRLNKVLELQSDKADGFFAPLQLNNPSISEDTRLKIQAYVETENITPEDIQRIAKSFQIIGEIQSTPVANPFDIQYFSAAPFLFGKDRAMKFSAKPCAEVSPSTIPEPPGDNYLRETLTEVMSRVDEIQFDFMVQVRGEGEDFGADNELIENASTLWDEADFPFVKVAKISIPAPQPEVDSEQNLAHCEQMAFSPWHSLVEHQPIGSINRLRKPVYQASSKHRREKKDSIVQLLENIFNSLFG